MRDEFDPTALSEEEADRLQELLAKAYPGSAARKKKVKKDEGGERTIIQDEEPVPVRATIKKSDDELQIVWGEVYVPGIPDAHGHFMTVDEVRKMAYRTLASGLLQDGQFQGSDVQHDNVIQDCVIVESFIARKGDETFLPDSWVVGLHIRDEGLWGQVKNGELNGFSIQASVYMHKQEVEIDIPDEVEGNTAGGSDGDLHRHGYRVRFNSEGEFLGGKTTSNVRDDGGGLHDHTIKRGSVTEPGGVNGHTHRFALVDMIFRQTADAADA